MDVQNEIIIDKNNYLEGVKDELFRCYIERELRRFYDGMLSGLYGDAPDPVNHHMHELFIELRRINEQFDFLKGQLVNKEELEKIQQMYYDEKAVCHKLQLELDKYKK